jgi:NADH dehydrogenase
MPHAQPPTQQLIVVGGGFAGTTLVRQLARRLPAHVQLTLLSDESYTTFSPMLPEAVGASVFPEQVVVPVREMLRPGAGRRFIMGEVRGVDLARRELMCHTLAGDIALPYDQLVLAVGSTPRLDLVPGMAEHALPLKTVGDAMHIRNTVLRRLARIELETDPVLREALGHFIVIGGGFSGVEVAGELIDSLQSIRRYYPGVNPGLLRVTLLHGGDRLLPDLTPALGEAAFRSLSQRGVDVLLLTRATEVSADGVTLAGNRQLRGHTVLTTAGVRANPLLELLGLPLAQGRVQVEPDLSVPGWPGLWALGDCACVPNAADGSVAPPTAQFAVRQAMLLAHNLQSVWAGRSTRAFSHRSKGMMASIGHLKGVAQAGRFQMSGLNAWLMWRAYYLSQMPSFGRRWRIFFEWFWGMFYPPDITHLRFTRSQLRTCSSGLDKHPSTAAVPDQ